MWYEGLGLGVLAAPVVAHMVCNFWGFPDFQGVAHHPQKRGKRTSNDFFVSRVLRMKGLARVFMRGCVFIQWDED